MISPLNPIQMCGYLSLRKYAMKISQLHVDSSKQNYKKAKLQIYISTCKIFKNIIKKSAQKQVKIEVLKTCKFLIKSSIIHNWIQSLPSCATVNTPSCPQPRQLRWRPRWLRCYWRWESTTQGPPHWRPQRRRGEIRQGHCRRCWASAIFQLCRQHRRRHRGSKRWPYQKDRAVDIRQRSPWHSP